MGDTDDYFPRGGKKPALTEFKPSSNFLGNVGQKEKKKKVIKKKKKQEGDDGYLSDDVTAEFDQANRNCAVGISYKIVKEGVLLLGRVQRTTETKVLMSLPCRMEGAVMACHISESYNKLLEDYVSDKIEKVRELKTMFKPGQYVATKVLEVDKERIMLSMMPHHVNSGKLHSDLAKGTLIQAAVSSVEDHGYVMELGMPNTRAFLPKNNTDENIELDVGVLTWCVVKNITPSTDNSIVTLSNHIEAIQQPVRRKPDKGIKGLLPGTALEFVVDKALESGIEGHIFDGIKAYIQRQHADKVKGKKPSLGQKVRAHLLYEMPTRKTPFLTMVGIFDSVPDLAAEQKYKIGDFVEDAQVIKITSRSVVFNMGKAIGTMNIKRVKPEDDLTDQEVIAQSYPIGSTHRIRVLCYNLLDRRYSVSTDLATMSAVYMSLEQLKVGDFLEGTVSVVRDSGLTIVADKIQGFVPQSHIFDSGICIDPKKPNTKVLPSKKFKVGQYVRARVLNVDSNSLVLTMKKSLLADDLELLTGADSATIGKAYTGTVKVIQPNYILVSFFNNAVAFIPKHFVTNDETEDLSVAFHPGQIVKCTIIKAFPETNKITGSLITAPFDVNKKRVKRKIENTDDQPKKKHKKDSESSDSDDENEETKNSLKNSNASKNKDVTKRKKKNDSISVKDVSTSEDTEKKTKKTKKSKDNDKKHEDVIQETTSLETKKTKKEKQKNKIEETTDIVMNETTTEASKKKKKDRKKKRKDSIVSDDGNTNDEVSLTVESTKEKKTKKDSISESEETESNKKSRQNSFSESECLNASEESDAIEIDMPDNNEILTPQDTALVNLDDCENIKQYKKRSVSLLKSINCKNRRLKVISKKIQAIEAIGLDRQNKKYHTAMHTEKMLIEERLSILIETWKKVQDKIKELPDDAIDYKKIQAEKKAEQKREKQAAKQTEYTIVNKDESIEEIKKVIKIAKPSEGLEVPSAKEFWNTDLASLYKAPEDKDESSSSDEETENQPKKKRKKLSTAEKVSKAREEENRLRELERQAVEGMNQPRSVEQFERALLANPDCSQLWIAYMAFHLQATEIDKARAIGRKALKTISFREEDEKLNVWLAMLNVENRFGTKESQQKTLEEALQMNEPYKVHSKLLEIYVETAKVQELSSLVDQMVRKYKRDPQTYIACGSACYKLGLVDKARQVMQKAITVLEKKEHVTVLVQFALLERATDRERSEALFEQILGVFPQRVDVAAVYLDMLTKGGDHERVRQVLERMTSQKLPARKMKVLYKKWIEIEEKIGDDDQIETIRNKAMEYIEKAKY